MADEIARLRDRVVNKLIQLNNAQSNMQALQEAHRKELQRIYLAIIEQMDEVELAERVALNKSAPAHQPAVRAEYLPLKNKLLQLMQRLHIVRLEAPYNLYKGYYDVVSTVNDPAKEDGTIISVIKDGYLCQDWLLRPTEVIAVKNSA